MAVARLLAYHGYQTLPFLLVCVLALGCNSHAKQVAQIRQAYYSNDVLSAQHLVEKRIVEERRDRDVLLLDAAMLELADGDAEQAESLLRTVRDHFDELEGLDVAEQAVVYLTDDQRRAYAGEDYEKILIRAFLALSNLLYDGDDAEAYSLQMIDKQERVLAAVSTEGTPEPTQANYQRVALAPYLRGVLREATHRDYADAQRSYATVVSWEPGFDPMQRDLQRASYGRHSAPGNGVLYVFALTGRGPYKEEAVQVPSSASLALASELISQFGPQTVPPSIAPVKVPQVVARPNRIASVQIDVDAQPCGATSTITDVTQLAVQQHAAIYPQVVARAVARRLLKKGVLYGAKQTADVSRDSAANVLVDLAGVAWEATESADTRCWGLLPDRIQVARIELPAGLHHVQLTPQLHTPVARGLATSGEIEIYDGANTYLLASFPDDRLVGRVLISHR